MKNPQNSIEEIIAVTEEATPAQTPVSDDLENNVFYR